MSLYLEVYRKSKYKDPKGYFDGGTSLCLQAILPIVKLDGPDADKLELSKNMLSAKYTVTTAPPVVGYYWWLDPASRPGWCCKSTTKIEVDDGNPEDPVVLVFTIGMDGPFLHG